MRELKEKVVEQGSEQKKNEEKETKNISEEKEEPGTIPSFLKPVNQKHVNLLKGYRMYFPAIGNGACGTN